MTQTDVTTPVFIVGLPENYRGVELEDDFITLGFGFTRVDGVSDVYENSPTLSFADQGSAKKYYGRELLAGEVGCALAHVRCYQRFVENEDANWALILEDDVRLTDQEAIRSIFFHLETTVTSVPKIMSLYGTHTIAMNGGTSIVDGYSVQELVLPPFSSAAYFINRAAAELLLVKAVPVISPADWPLATLGYVSYSLVYPRVVKEGGSENSTIGAREQVVKSKNLRNNFLRVGSLLLSATHIYWLSDRKALSYRSYLWLRIFKPVLNFVIGKEHIDLVPDNHAKIPSPKLLARTLARTFRIYTDFLGRLKLK